MPTIAQLNQRHPSLDLEHHEDLVAIYEGDRKFFERVKCFLHQREREPATRYQTRLKEAQYRNYTGPAVDYFTAMLFKARPAPVATQDGEAKPDPGEYYEKLRDDCDRNGANIDAVFKGRLTDAMVGGRSWLRIHAPTDESLETGEKITLKDFEERGVSDCWLEPIDYECVLDWETDDAGRLLWAIVYRQESKREDVSGDRSKVTDIWDYLTPDFSRQYRITYDRDKPPPAETTNVDAEPDVKHRFGRVPLVCLDLPVGLWVANRLKSPQLAHFRAVNAQAWSLAATCYAMAVAKVKDPTAYAAATVGTARELVINVEEDWGWVAPPSDHFSALDTEIKAAKDEIFRIVSQMAVGVDNNAAAVGRSGESKAADIEATKVVLLAYSRAVKEAIEYTYDLIARVRGETFKWSVRGLDDFAALDAGGLAETLKLIKDVGGIPSKTWNVEVKSMLAEAITPDLDQETKGNIRKEIEAGEPDPVAEREEEKKAAAEMHQATIAAAANKGQPGKPGAPGAKPFPPKPASPPAS